MRVITSVIKAVVGAKKTIDDFKNDRTMKKIAEKVRKFRPPKLEYSPSFSLDLFERVCHVRWSVKARLYLMYNTQKRGRNDAREEVAS